LKTYWYFDSIPEKYLCYLNDTKHPTLKFDPTIDQAGDVGWSCITSDKKECIPKRFICDKTKDCKYGSDEVKGCDLYPGIYERNQKNFIINLTMFILMISYVFFATKTSKFIFLETNCSSWFEKKYERKCPNNDRCFNTDSFTTTRDCNDSVWTECHRLDDWKTFLQGVTELYHCNSGDCVPKSDVCDGVPNCQDGSDETDGCKLIPGTVRWTLFEKYKIHYYI